MPDRSRYDLLLSHGSPDKPWVETLARELEALDLKVFLDTVEIRLGENFVLRLSEGLGQSRFLVLIMSSQTFGRPWVDQEWTAFLAEHGPTGRVLPVLIEATEMPTILKATQYLVGTHRDAARVARELAVIAGRPGERNDEARSLPAQALSFVLGRTEEALEVTGPDGRTRTVTPPWVSDGARFAVARLGFQGLSRKAIESGGSGRVPPTCAMRGASSAAVDRLEGGTGDGSRSQDLRLSPAELRAALRNRVRRPSSVADGSSGSGLGDRPSAASSSVSETKVCLGCRGRAWAMPVPWSSRLKHRVWLISQKEIV